MTLMDRNVAHTHTNAYCSHTLGANNSHINAFIGRMYVCVCVVVGGWGGGARSHTGCSVPAHLMSGVKCLRPSHAASLRLSIKSSQKYMMH